MGALTSPHNIDVWFAASSKYISQNPKDLPATHVHIGLGELYKMYIQKQPALQPLNKRHEIYHSFTQAGKQGYSRGMFFSGLALIEGFGCNRDPQLGNDLVRVAADWHNCDLAINHRRFVEGCEKLFKNGSYVEAIRLLKSAGAIARPVLEKLSQHFKHQQLRLSQQQNYRPKLVLAS